MEYILDAGQMKEVDTFSIKEAGIPSLVLMERAALGVSNLISDTFNRNMKVICVAGNGNNGADAAACARILFIRGFDVSVCLPDGTGNYTGELKKQLEIADNLNIKRVTIDKIDDYDIVVDGIFGIGLSRNVEGVFKETIIRINNSRAVKIAVDIPSGIDATDGSVLGVAVKADYTVTFGYKKTGLILYPGAEYAGEVRVAECGFAPAAIYGIPDKKYTYDLTDLKRLPIRKADSNKGSYGKILCIAGSENMSGAAYFSAKSAYRCGAGLVRILTAGENMPVLKTLVPEAVFVNGDDITTDELKRQAEWADIIVIGPGLSTGDYGRRLLYTVLNLNVITDKMIILDADALNIIAEDGAYELLSGCIITPHLGEMMRLTGIRTGEIKRNIVNVAKEFATKYGCICVLKDSRTIVSDGREVYINTSGNNGMATAGAGDVLTGIMAGVLSGGMNKRDGAILSVYIHGLSGDDARAELGEFFMTADDIIEHIKNVIHG